MSRRTQKQWSKKHDDPGPYDAIVIGSGMGGMTTAALLAAVGRKVLVLEQHYVPGGFTHTFKRPGGYHWDVGVHAVGEVTRHTITGKLLDKLTRGGLEWASLGEHYEEFYFPEGFRLDFPDNPKAFRQNLVEAFPEEEEAIDAYFREVKKVSASMRGYYLARSAPRWVAPLLERWLAADAQQYLERNTAEYLASVTQNPRLRTILSGQWGYYGSPPSRSSFAIQALVTKHFSHGGYYPVGGSGRIAEELLKTVADAGGWTRISTSVEEILLEKGRAVGVRLGNGEEIRARRIISAAGVGATLRRLLPESVRSTSWGQDVLKLNPAPAHVCLYLGFKGDIQKAGASGANKWFWNTWDSEASVWEIDRAPLPNAPLLYCSFPSLKDPLHEPGPDKKHTGEVVTFVPWESFEAWKGSRWKKRGEDYDAFKSRLEASLLEQFFSFMPELRPMLDHVELSSPLSTDHFCRPVRGSIYGIEPTPRRFMSRGLRPDSPVPGLYFSGSEVSSVGVIGAMVGGVMAALAADPWRVLSYLRKLS